MEKQKKTVQSVLTTFIKHKHTDKKQSVNSDLSKSQNQGSQQEKKVQPQKPALINVQFYRNQRVSEPNGDYINNIHKHWADNFNLLQRHHGFIQWLFPNSFSSRFNSKSSALIGEEQKTFRNDIQIAKRYVYSYQIMLRFYGMRLKSKQTGEIIRSRNPDSRQRYMATLLTSFHNHMRITRILCSLTMIGFGRYAKQLSLFLKSQIHGANGDLRPLAKFNVDKDWKEYENYIQAYDDLNVYLKRFEDQKTHEKQQNQKITKITEKQQQTQKNGKILEKKKQ